MNPQTARTLFDAAARSAQILTHYSVLVCAALAFAGSASAAVDVVGKGKVSLNWAAASGPVAGYGVFISRNGKVFPSVPNKVTLANEPSASVSGKVGDVVIVRVAAFDDSGNYGPPSTASEAIRFVDPGEPNPLPPTGGGGGGGGGGAGGGGGSIDGVCDGIGDLEGKSKVKLVKGAKRKTKESMLVTLCDGRWAAVDGDGTRLSGDYQVLNEGRRYALFLDRDAYNALVSAAQEDSEGLVENRVASWFNEQPRIRVKLNRKQTRAKFKVSSEVMSSIAGELAGGSYDLSLAGKVIRE